MTTSANTTQTVDQTALRNHLVRLRGEISKTPDASIVIPVNAQGDLGKALDILSDIATYAGDHALEIVLVVNNYPPDNEPAEVETLRNLGVVVLSVPNLRRAGEPPGFSARMYGARAARSENVLLFDADCRIPHATALINWYVEQLQSSAQVAYTRVGYYELLDDLSVKLRIWIHHAMRWFKRVVLRVPTTRGSNYAFNRSVALKYYDDGWLADEMNVGPTIRKLGGRVAYSGASDLVVLTSGRMFRGGWSKIPRYFLYRLRYNLRVLRVRPDAAQRTGRERNPIRRYVNNVPVKDDKPTSSHDKP